MMRETYLLTLIRPLPCYLCFSWSYIFTIGLFSAHHVYDCSYGLHFGNYLVDPPISSLYRLGALVPFTHEDFWALQMEDFQKLFQLSFAVQRRDMAVSCWNAGLWQRHDRSVWVISIVHAVIPAYLWAKGDSHFSSLFIIT